MGKPAVGRRRTALELLWKSPMGRVELLDERGPPEALTRSSVRQVEGELTAAFTSVVKKWHSHHGTCCACGAGVLAKLLVREISQKMPRRPSGVLQPVSCPLLRRMSAVEPPVHLAVVHVVRELVEVDVALLAARPDGARPSRTAWSRRSTRTPAPSSSPRRGALRYASGSFVELAR